MADLKVYSRVAGTNKTAPPDGWPEGMKRSDLNDTAREFAAAVRRFYEAPEWLDLLQEDDGYTVSKIDSDSFNVVYDGTSPTSAVPKFPVGARVRVGDGSTLIYGFVSAVSFVTPNTIVDLTLDDVALVVQVGANTAETFHGRDALGEAAFSDIGTTLLQKPPEIPSIDDLGDGVKKDEGHDPEGDGSPGFDADTVDTFHAQDFFDDSASSSENILINGSFGVFQRGTTLTQASPVYKNDNGAFCADRWILLQGVTTARPSAGVGMVDITRMDNDPPLGGSPWAIEIKANASIGSPTAEKVGVLTMMPRSSCKHLRGQKVSLSFYARVNTGTAIGTIRAGIVEWSGSPDAISAKDAINDWQAQGTDPTLITNYAFSASGTAPFSPTDAWTEFKLEDITLGGGFENLGVLLWIDDTGWVANDFLRLGAASLVRGSRARKLATIHYTEELTNCLRFYETTFRDDETPAQATGILGTLPTIGSGDGTVLIDWQYAAKFKIPTVTTFSPISANNNMRNVPDAADVAVALTTIGVRGVHFEAATSAGNSNDKIVLHADAVADIY